MVQRLWTQAEIFNHDAIVDENPYFGLSRAFCPLCQLISWLVEGRQEAQRKATKQKLLGQKREQQERQRQEERARQAQEQERRPGIFGAACSSGYWL